MIHIRTEKGNFGRFKDLLRFMQEENIEKMYVETYFLGDKVNKLLLTQEDVKNIIEKE